MSASKRRQVACISKIWAISLVIVLSGLATIAQAQDQPAPLDLSAFDGHETWPLYEPGDIDVDNKHLKDQRIIFDATFPGPEGPLGPLQPTTMIMDVFDVYFKGEPALWIQWTSTGAAGWPSGTGSVDYLIVDKATHRTQFRVQSAGGPGTGTRDRAGPHFIWHFPDEAVIRTLVKEDGSSELTQVNVEDAGTIDYAALPFWLPFIELEAGMKFRVPYYMRALNDINGLPIYVQGRDTIEDAHGSIHEVWRIQVMSINGGAVSEFWISENEPYFLGWDVRITRNAKPVTQMWYNRHWNLER